ncbi:uncharacterized protein BDW47DRAFT_109923 [Aspergillus candidus]|uniref:Tim44-like domain-containing protein n=1 Tax=Aspergillus candidus TaxID=41067 RepID=A0A2I2F4U1_ASPCN|nr:hypothetical protein BDW47DRAFT_109923 [Aspergillus candidus]PLB35653.1 hypothetical protein BDW47DRAFT_109923 [Aspergillus candidus]
MASSLAKGPLVSTLRSNNVLSQRSSGPLAFVSAASQCRQFSNSPQHGMGNMRGVPQNFSVKQPAQPSTKTRGRELSRADLPQDIGLLPGTYVRQLWRDMPSIFHQPAERLRLEWLWLKTGFQNFLGLLAYCKWVNKGLPLRLKERRQVAGELHQRMYTAFADGNLPLLRKTCCTGLANNLGTRISTRPKDEKVTWHLDKYIRSPSTFLTGIRVVSDRATQIPELPDSGVRQVVVRITSRQSTGKSKVRTQRGQQTPANEVEEAAPVKQQDCTEYIVIQKLRWVGEETDWKVWGHTSPTTVDNLNDPAFAAGLTMRERMEAIQDQMAGKK